MRRPDTDTALAAGAAAGLLLWNNGLGATRWHERHYVAANLTGTVALLALARSRGATVGELGLDPFRLGAGGRAGAAVASPVAAGLGLALAVPGWRRRLRDERVARLGPSGVTRHALLRIPLGTAAWEEVAFRAALPALLRRATAPHPGALTHLLFGLWHVRPALDAARLNGLRGRRAAGYVAGSVAATTAVSALLTALRRRSGSLAAPVVLHATVNALATVAVAVAERISRGPSTPPRPATPTPSRCAR